MSRPSCHRCEQPATHDVRRADTDGWIPACEAHAETCYHRGFQVRRRPTGGGTTRRGP